MENVEPISDEKFRFTSSKVFLTYAQADGLERSRVEQALRDLGISKGYGGQELHEDGGRHFHVVAIFAKKKVDIRNCRFFDIDGCHPNIRHVKSLESAYAYAGKNGDTFSWGEIDILTARGKIQGFRSLKADLEEFQRHCRQKTVQSPWPLDLPDGTVLQQPDAGERQRCLYVWGAPNTGKSYWFSERLDGKSVYSPAGTEELAFDTYGGELLIVYDDSVPSLRALIQVLNFSSVDKPVPGRTRYYQRFLPGRQVRFVIVLANKRIPWEPFCSIGVNCDCAGCTRCIYYNWDKFAVNLVAPSVRKDFS